MKAKGGPTSTTSAGRQADARGIHLASGTYLPYSISIRCRSFCSITTAAAVAAAGIPWLPVLPSPGRRNCCAGAQQHEGNPKYRCVAEHSAGH